MNNIVSFKADLVSQTVDAIFNDNFHHIDIQNFARWSNEYDYFKVVMQEVEKVIGDFIINSFRFVKENRCNYSPEGFAHTVVENLRDKANAVAPVRGWR